MSHRRARWPAAMLTALFVVSIALFLGACNHPSVGRTGDDGVTKDGGASPVASAPNSDLPSGVYTGAEPEKYVVGLFKGDATSDADGRKIISALPRLNWSAFNKESGGQAMKLMTWLEGRQIENVPDVAFVLAGSGGLDGAYTEKYSAVVGSLLSRDPENFVRALGMLTDDQANRVIPLVAHYMSSDADSTTHVNDVIKSGNLSEREKDRAQRLLGAMQ